MTTAQRRPPAGDAGTRHTGGRRTLGLVLGACALAGACWLSLVAGSADVSLSAVWRALTDFDGSYDQTIVRETRLPRTVAGLLVGLALGVAGTLIQAVTRNPLADPGILGVNAGSAFFVALALAVSGGMSIAGYVWFALLGALVATCAVYVIAAAGRGPASPERLVLSGVALAAVLSGIVTGFVLLDPETFDRMRFWSAGSLSAADLPMLGTVLPFVAAGLLLAALVARPLNAVALGEELAGALGANLTLVRAGAVVAVTLLAGGATAIAGPVGFVGLMMPHVARWIVGPDQRWIVAVSVLLSPVLVLTADVLGRVLVGSGEVPVGVVVAFVGAPVLVGMVRRRRASTS
ncbi:iron chelate uptake ABC transporter family permease subunit [Prauserella cavernicola]|uniref:Iron chelate uptake ABC transporter family permease subunit n=1 Tax=Prauserella cavernicola TaxID=2800127 RepID=A0A934V435_9PSEU|nr:iron chelate uptake ABC transporter family permease subunit [Prauserella cavernicola]MBK1783163.1 iron chelate uptake ABC transporter family permease subunit [Prauserella cavernicola]